MAAAPKNTTPEAPKAERVVALIGGESGSGKSFFVANLRNALIFDTDVGGGLSYADARIKANGSERIEVGSYLEILTELEKRRKDKTLDGITTLAIDHLSTLQQEATIRHNPKMEADYGKAGNKGAGEWRKIRDMVRLGEFNLICTSHLKAVWANNAPTNSFAPDASKNIEGDMMIVLYLKKPLLGRVSRTNLSTAMVMKWRRDPDDARPEIPDSFPFTIEELVRLHGFNLDGARHAIPMATEEQVAELVRLLGIVKLEEGTEEAWKKKAKVETWDEMTEAQIVACINYLTKALTKGAK